MKKNAIIYREANFDDISELIELEKEVWGDGMIAESEKWESRIKIFPEGVYLAILQGKIIGVVVCLIVDWKYPENYYPDWFEVSDNGYISNHSMDGQVLYGIDMTVSSKSVNVASKLLKRVFYLREKYNKSGGMLGSRIPTLSSYVKNNNIKVVDEELVSRVARLDPTVNFFMQGRMRWVGPKKDYYPPDEESLGWGLILEHFE